MSVRTRIEPLSQSLTAIIDQDLSLAAQAKVLAGFARATLKEAQEVNQAALGRVPDHEQFVDRVRGATFDSARPNSRIAIEFDLAQDVIEFIAAELVRLSPVHSGAYRRSHMLFADGREVRPGEVTEAEEYVFTNPVPYSRRIELARMKMRVPGTDQVYARAAAAAQRRFGNIATIRMSFRSPIGLSRKAATAARAPAIVVALR